MRLCWSGSVGGAGDGSRTRDVQLGRLELYQLSYSRIIVRFSFLHGHLAPAASVNCSAQVDSSVVSFRLVGGLKLSVVDLWRGKDSNLRSQWRQIYSLFPLTAREPLLVVASFRSQLAMGLEP